MLLEGGLGLAKDARADSNFDFCTELVKARMMRDGETAVPCSSLQQWLALPFSARLE